MAKKIVKEKPKKSASGKEAARNKEKVPKSPSDQSAKPNLAENQEQGFVIGSKVEFCPVQIYKQKTK